MRRVRTALLVMLIALGVAVPLTGTSAYASTRASNAVTTNSAAATAHAPWLSGSVAAPPAAGAGAVPLGSQALAGATARTVTKVIPISQAECDDLKAVTGRTGKCAMTLTVSVKQVAAPAHAVQPAGAYPWRYFVYSGNLQGALDAWQYNTSAEVANNGVSAWLQGSVSCWEDHAYGVSISRAPNDGGWCGAAQNGAGYYGYAYMNFGFNILVTAFVQGFPISHSHWYRLNVYNNGSDSSEGA